MDPKGEQPIDTSSWEWAERDVSRLVWASEGKLFAARFGRKKMHEGVGTPNRVYSTGQGIEGAIRIPLSYPLPAQMQILKRRVHGGQNVEAVGKLSMTPKAAGYRDVSFDRILSATAAKPIVIR